MPSPSDAFDSCTLQVYAVLSPKLRRTFDVPVGLVTVILLVSVLVSLVIVGILFVHQAAERTVLYNRIYTDRTTGLLNKAAFVEERQRMERHDEAPKASGDQVSRMPPAAGCITPHISCDCGPQEEARCLYLSMDIQGFKAVSRAEQAACPYSIWLGHPPHTGHPMLRLIAGQRQHQPRGGRCGAQVVGRRAEGNTHGHKAAALQGDCLPLRRRRASNDL